MYDFEHLDTREWQQVLKLRKQALKTYLSVLAKYRSLPMASELADEELDVTLTEDEKDVLYHALTPPVSAPQHPWMKGELTEEEQREEDEAAAQEDRMMERADISYAMMQLNNLMDRNTHLLKNWLYLNSSPQIPRNTPVAMSALELLNDNSFMLTFVPDAIMRGLKEMGLALLAETSRNITEFFELLFKEYKLVLHPADRDFYKTTQEDFARAAQELQRALENLQDPNEE